ncbi:MAG: sugar phosphate isomerase/epimerase family protein [Christensenellales bacterium]|jgi:sugar phosphate isomerase/epimerase
MNESIHKYFKVGLIHFMAFPSTIKGEGPILETLREILVDDYFDAVEVTWMKDDEVRKKAADMMAQSHIKVCYGAQPRLLTTGLNPNAIDEADRQKAEDTLIEAIDEAEFLGSDGIAFLSGKWSKETQQQNYDQLLKTTLNLCKYAKEKNMKIELEVFDFDLDKASLIGPAPLAAKFAADVRNHYNNFGLMVDLSHFPQTYETSKFALQVMRPYITHLHIGSAVMTPGAEAFGDTHPRFGFPNGCNDTEEVLDFLRQCKNEGLMNADDPMVLSFEVKPWKDEDPALVIANAKRVLNRAWSLL